MWAMQKSIEMAADYDYLEYADIHSPVPKA